MAGQKAQLSSKQQGMIRALLGGLTIRDAAKAGQVSERTAYRWLRLPAFRAELRAQSSGAMAASAARFGTAFDKALVIVCAALDGRAVCDAEKWAAGLVLQHAAALVAFFDLESRVSALEANIEADTET